jgi:hypothetical protein
MEQLGMQLPQRVALRLPERDPGREGRIIRQRGLDGGAALGRELAVDPGVQVVVGRGRGGAVHGVI